jgi:hypothetical protein
MYIYIYRAKGYSRLGAALHGKGEWKTAIDAYKMGLELDPENALLKVRDLPDSNTGHYIQTLYTNMHKRLHMPNFMLTRGGVLAGLTLTK